MSRNPGSRDLAVFCSLTIIAVGLGVAAFGWRKAQGDEIAGGVAIVALGGVLFAWSVASASPAVARLASLGGLAQVSAVLIYYYPGTALDAARYHGDAMAVLGGRPAFGSASSEWGTDMMAFLLSLLYRLTVPSMLLGFVAFAVIALIGKVVLARALLLLTPTLGPMATVAAWAVLLLPSLNIWLAAISKESFVVLGIGLVLAALLRPARSPNYVMIAVGLGAVSLTRPHIAVLLAFSLVAYAAAYSKMGEQTLGRRLVMIIVGGLFGLLTLSLAADFLGVEASISGLEEAREDVSTTMDEGGSNIEQRPIRSVADAPRGVATVLLRPHLFEADSAAQLAQAVETTLLAFVTMFLVVQRRRRARRPVGGIEGSQVRAIRAFTLTYAAGFTYAYSGAYNLGLMSRQRVQVMLPLIVLASTALVHVVRRSGRSSGRRRGRPDGPVLVVRMPLTAAEDEPAPNTASPSPPGPRHRRREWASTPLLRPPCGSGRTSTGPGNVS